MPRQITQAELDLARLGMVIARLQFKALATTAGALGDMQLSKAICECEFDMAKLAEAIHSGEIRGSDAGQG